MTPDECRAKLSGIVLGLPGVVERGGQHSRYSVRDRTVAYFLDDHHGDGIVAVTGKAPPGSQADVIARDPQRYFVPSYLGARGWVALRLDTPTLDWGEVEELVVTSYRLVAPKRLVAQLDAAQPDEG